MAIHIALLRGINVGGSKMVPMAELRSLLSEFGFENPRSLLQSGNLVFGADAKKTPAGLEKTLEAAVEKRFGATISIVVRTAAQWTSVVARNPFPEEAKRDPGHLLVMALKGAPKADTVASLRASYSGPEAIAVDGSEAYLVYPVGIGKSKLTNQLLEKQLGVVGTARNWNTVLKLAGLVKG